MQRFRSQTFNLSQNYESIANALLIRVKTAKNLFDKDSNENISENELIDELNKCRQEYLRIKLDELKDIESKLDIKSLINYFDELTGNNYRLKVLQIGLEEFVRQTSEECRELAHLFLFLWKGFQKEATAQLKQIFERTNKLINYLKFELQSNKESVINLQNKNNDLILQNLNQK